MLLVLFQAGLLEGPFQAVFINDQDVAEFGAEFPPPRRYLADAVVSAQDAGAKAIVLKFFLDLPAGNPEDDRKLAHAITAARVPVILQANLDPSGEAVPLPERFFRSDAANRGGLISGDRGWLPLPIFANGASAVGFIASLNPASLIESYQGRVVPGLFLITLEQALGPASFEAQHVTLGANRLPLIKGCINLPFPATDDLKPLSLSALLSGKLGEKLKGVVVVIGYDGEKMHALPTPIGPIKAHRLFFYELELAFAAFTEPVTLRRQSE